MEMSYFEYSNHVIYLLIWKTQVEEIEDKVESLLEPIMENQGQSKETKIADDEPKAEDKSLVEKPSI